MRAWILAAVAIGATGVAMAQRAADPTPGLDRLARPGSLYMILVEDGVARCQRWAVVPGAAGQGQLTRAIESGGERGTDTIDFELAPDGLIVTGRGRTIADHASTTCAVPLAVEAVDGALAVGGGHWFDDAAGCEAALARHARVATDLRDCELDPIVPAAVRAATQRDFVAVLRGGGDVYVDVDGRCLAVHVAASRTQPVDGASGRFWRPIVERGRRGRASVGYRLLSSGKVLAQMGAGATFPNGGYGVGCLGQTYVWYLDREVVAGRSLYLTRARCRSAVALDAWLPPAPAFDPTPARTESSDAIEGPRPTETSPLRQDAEAPAPGAQASDADVGVPIGC